MSQANSDQLFQYHIFERVFQAMGAMVAVFDLVQQRIVYHNGALAETLVYSMERTRG